MFLFFCIIDYADCVSVFLTVKLILDFVTVRFTRRPTRFFEGAVVLFVPVTDRVGGVQFVPLDDAQLPRTFSFCLDRRICDDDLI